MAEQAIKQVDNLDLDLQLDSRYMYWEAYQVDANIKRVSLSFPAGILRLQRLRIFPFAYRVEGSPDNWLPISFYIAKPNSDKRIELVQERKFQRKYQYGALDDSGAYTLNSKIQIAPTTDEIELCYKPDEGEYMEFANPNNFPVGFIFVYQMQKSEDYATNKNYQNVENVENKTE